MALHPDPTPPPTSRGTPLSTPTDPSIYPVPDLGLLLRGRRGEPTREPKRQPTQGRVGQTGGVHRYSQVPTTPVGSVLSGDEDRDDGTRVGPRGSRVAVRLSGQGRDTSSRASGPSFRSHPSSCGVGRRTRRLVSELGGGRDPKVPTPGVRTPRRPPSRSLRLSSPPKEKPERTRLRRRRRTKGVSETLFGCRRKGVCRTLGEDPAGPGSGGTLR